MSYNPNAPRSRNAHEFARTEANFPLSRTQMEQRPNGIWGPPPSNLPSHQIPTRANPEPNPFATGSLVDALAEVSSSSTPLNSPSPARAIRPRRNTHRQQASSSGSRHHSHRSPPTSSRLEEEERAARVANIQAMQQALSVRQGPARPPPLPVSNTRQPLVLARQPGDIRAPAQVVAARPEQREVEETTQGGVVRLPRRAGRRVAAMYPVVGVQPYNRGIHQQPGSERSRASRVDENGMW